MTTIRQEAIRFQSARNALAVCVGLALTSSVTGAGPAAPMSPANTTWTVESCDDDGPGSLRQALSMAADQDSIDLTMLACSTITLTSGQLAVDVDNIQLFGADILIDAGGTHRVLYHTGTGTLSASGIVFASGLGGGAPGGCIYSRGSIEMDHVTVRDCLTSGPTNINGGGIFARGDIELRYSAITGNRTVVTNPGPYDGASGAGLCTDGRLALFNSTISGNSLLSTSLYSGGGGFASGHVTIDHSTISGNHANRAGAGMLENWPPGSTGSSIIDSTISGNTSQDNNAGIMSFDDLLIRNSSIVFNATANGFCGAGVLEWSGELDMDSSIVAGNTAIGDLADDICLQGNSLSVAGANNIVIASFGDLPADTIRTDPLLAPLADNGGWTMTHALLPGSPAIDHGSNLSQLDTDQRGLARVFGGAPDIGAFELQPPDEIFANGFDPSG